MKRIKRMVNVVAILLMVAYIGSVFIPFPVDAQDAFNEDEKLKGDINGDGRITLEDAQQALKAALHMKELSNEELWAADIYNTDEITLQNAQIILKAAVKAVRIEDVTAQNKPTTPPTPSCSTEQPQEFAQIYISVLENYNINYSCISYLAINEESLQYASETDKRAIVEYFEKKTGLPVKMTTWEKMREEGLILDGAHLGWRLEGAFIYIKDIDRKENEIIVDGGIAYHGLDGAVFRSVLQKQDGKWVLVSRKNLIVS